MLDARESEPAVDLQAIRIATEACSGLLRPLHFAHTRNAPQSQHDAVEMPQVFSVYDELHNRLAVLAIPRLHRANVGVVVRNHRRQSPSTCPSGCRKRS